MTRQVQTDDGEVSSSVRCERLCLGVVLERRRSTSRWAAESWRVAEVLPGAASPSPWTVIAEGEGWQRFHAGEVALDLFRTETAGYRDNLASATPSIWIVLRRGGPHGVFLHAATVDPGEIEAHSDAGDDLIEAVPMPPALAARVRAFVDRHHVERPFWKRRRDRADPEALARRAGGHG